MSAADSPCFLYSDLPAGISQSTLTAMANALGIELLAFDKGLYKSLSSLGQKFETLSADKKRPLFVFDIDQLRLRGLSIVKLSQLIDSPELKRQIFLCQTQGYVSSGTRQLIKSLGFAELVADFDPRDLSGGDHAGGDKAGGLKVLIDWIGAQTPIAAGRLGRLPAFLKTVSLIGNHESPRALVQRLCGHRAELLVNDLIKHVETKDRSYRLKNYDHCFLGKEACTHLQTKFRLVESQALAVGKALQTLGLLYHVAHEQPFANEAFFYRFATSSGADKISAAEVWSTLASHIDIADRQYLGKEYPMCFIGSQAVAHLATQWSITREDAWIVLHRFEKLRLIEHVTQEHGFIDGNFFYRLS
jgi:hypothetical protein